jgi:hypothetical protein
MEIMKKLPDTGFLKRQIETVKVKQSITFLRAKHSDLAKYEDVEDLVFRVDLDNPPLELRGFDYHFRQVRRAFSKALWERGIYIGLSVIDQLLFSGFRLAPPIDPVVRALNVIRDNGVHKAGFVLYPIHSMGINSVGFFEFFSKARVQLAIESAGLVLRAQTNGFDGSFAFLNEARHSFGIEKKIKRDLVEHYNRSRTTKWFTHNPLLAVQVRMFSGEYYENQRFLVVKLQTVTSLLFMMAGLQTGYTAPKVTEWGSSRRVNNFQTLDIHHYFVFERPVRGTYLNMKCVPMNVRPSELADLSSLPIDLVPKLWSKRLHIINELASHLAKLESKYMAKRVLGTEDSGASVANGKMFMALHYFRRSFKSRGDTNEQVVNLAIAFEVLLSSNDKKGVTARFDRRIKLALKGVKGTRRLQAATEKLYEVRSETVHSGQPKSSYNLTEGQEAFVYVFLSVARKVDGVPASSSDPIGAILGD